ncbi:unnamed protein product [Rhizoctonia solani]|uniref:mitogen-activated protein kinase kinase kinase n=1 Tax=Rhizoctonia solani TaxID=456999 RepID=A0A8H2WPY3_9AGAM|nr:unnamed protein product [Rhizoctonia solani]
MTTSKSYISMMTVLYDFTPEQGDEGTGLAVREGQSLLLLDASNDEAHRKLIYGNWPHNQADFISVATAYSDFVARVDGDLTVTEHEALLVYCVEGDWVLVKSPHQRAAGYVPRARIQLEQELDRVIALYDNDAASLEELNFKQGEILTVLNRDNQEWWYCANTNYDIGMVPYNFVEDANEVMPRLVAHGCNDLTSAINLSTFDEHPVSYGEFGDVYRGRLTDEAETLIAVKILRIPMSDRSWISENVKDAARELHTWSKCSHPNVLPLLGLGLFRGRIGMISPWQREGRLPLYLERTQGVNRYNLSVQICEGLSYLHQIGIIHADLKASNVLVSHDGVPLLFDFGNSWLANRTMSFTRTGRGLSMSLRWAAPELIEETNSHSEKSDVYALGMTLYEVMTGQLPYYGKSDVLVILLVVQKREPPERPESIPDGHETMDNLWELLLRCWSFEPTARPSAAGVAEAVKTLRADAVLSRKMAAREVVSHLVAHGCRDLSGELDLASFGEYPVSHGGLSDIYRGELLDGARVAVKVLRVSIDNISREPKHLKVGSVNTFS